MAKTTGGQRPSTGSGTGTGTRTNTEVPQPEKRSGVTNSQGPKAVEPTKKSK